MHIEKENVLYLRDKPDDVKRENVFIKREREERAPSSTPRARGRRRYFTSTDFWHCSIIGVGE